MYTSDAFLGGKLHIKQPKTGYRAGSDAVFLAASLPMTPGDRLLDLGCGVGTIFLCALARNPQLQVTGVDLNPENVALAQENLALNGYQGHVVVADVETLALPERFTQVTANPPYYPADEHTPSPNAHRSTSHNRGATLTPWVKAASQHLLHKGRFTLIIPSQDLAETLGILKAHTFGDIHIFPLWSKAQGPAKRTLLWARKGIKTGETLCPGLVLHQEDGTVTPEASGIANLGQPLPSLRGTPYGTD